MYLRGCIWKELLEEARVNIGGCLDYLILVWTRLSGRKEAAGRRLAR